MLTINELLNEALNTLSVFEDKIITVEDDTYEGFSEEKVSETIARFRKAKVEAELVQAQQQSKLVDLKAHMRVYSDDELSKIMNEKMELVTKAEFLTENFEKLRLKRDVEALKEENHKLTAQFENLLELLQQGEMKFKAKPSPEFYSYHEGCESCEWALDYMDSEGYIHGQVLKNDEGRLFIVGDLFEATEEYTNLRYWIPIDKATLLFDFTPEISKKLLDKSTNEHYFNALKSELKQKFDEGYVWIARDFLSDEQGNNVFQHGRLGVFKEKPYRHEIDYWVSNDHSSCKIMNDRKGFLFPMVSWATEPVPLTEAIEWLSQEEKNDKSEG